MNIKIINEIRNLSLIINIWSSLTNNVLLIKINYYHFFCIHCGVNYHLNTFCDFIFRRRYKNTYNYN